MSKIRVKALEKLAFELKMGFEPVEDWGLIRLLGDFHLFRRGKRKRILNVMRNRDDLLNTDIRIFDYHFTISTGKSTRRIRQTVFFVSSKQLGLPQFFMKPENILHKIGSFFGIQDIDFEAFPDFSRQYLLKGEDEDYIRSAFNEHLLKFFTIEKNWSLEGINYFLILYKNQTLLSPPEIKKFHKKGMQLFDILANNQEV